LSAELSGEDAGVWLADFPCPAPDLWLTGNFVGELSAMGQPTKPTQPSIPLGSVVCITEVEAIKRQLGLQAKVELKMFVGTF